MRIMLAILCLGLFSAAPAVYANGCNAACYAQKNAAKQRQLAARRQQARIAHNKAIAAQKARRAAANRKRAQAAQAKANALRKQRQLALARQRAAAARNKGHQPRRHHHRPRQQARRHHHQPRRHHRRLTPQQQLAALLVLQQRNRNYNIASRAYQNSMNNTSYRLRRQSAIHSCQYTGTCRVVTRRLY